MTGTILTYKGYSVRVDYSAEDCCLVGRVLGIGDIIDCEGETMDEVKRDFHNAIDAYLDACKTWGKKPDTPDHTGLQLELPAAAYDQLSRNAKTSGQSVDQLAVKAILAAYPAKNARAKTGKTKPSQARKGTKPRQGGKRTEAGAVK